MAPWSRLWLWCRQPRPIGLGLALVALGGIGFVPLFDGPGYEAALAAGALLPGMASVVAALTAGKNGGRPLDALGRGVLLGAELALVGLLVAWLHGLRAGLCDPWEGTAMFLLGPGVGAPLGGAWGAATALVLQLSSERVGLPGAGRPARVMLVTAALAGPLGGVGVSLLRFYTSPMVFAFDPFLGFFAGTLYDSVITGQSRLVTYRLGSLATLLATFCAAALFERDAEGNLSRVRAGRGGLLAVALGAGAASVALTLAGPSLGHYQTSATIRAALGQSVTVGRCEVVYAAGTPELEARALAKDCDGHVTQLERFFGARGPERVAAFVFASTGQKGYLMGAAGTYIAKPWREEIYIQRGGFPHPVMRHELAHVVAGAFGRGPFRVAGPLSGVIPDPGRIEGIAVAAAPRDDDLALEEWARAMRDLKLLPSLDRVFKLSFLGEPSSRAYVVAGAFVEWLGRAHGMDAVRGWYGGASLPAVTGGKDLAALEREWHRSLDGLTVSERIQEVARARFDRPAIFGRRCPHVVDRLSEEAGSALGRLDTEEARRLYADLLELDPHELGARLALATCAERERKPDEAVERYDLIARDTRVGRAARARAVEALGDLAFARGDAAEARRRYDEASSVLVDTDRLRTLDVKRWALGEGVGARGRAALVAHLFGDPRLGRDGTEASSALGAWSEAEPEIGMADYLVARAHVGAGRWDLAAPSLDRALSRSLPLPSVRREALRLRVITACAVGDAARVSEVHEQWASLPEPRRGERREMAELVERCTGKAGEAGGPSAAAAASATASAPVPAPAPAPSVSPPVDAAPAASVCPPGMVKIPGAETWIGSRRGVDLEDEWPRYRTRLASFCLDRTEVTVSAYQACVQAGSCKPAGSDRVTCTTSREHGPDHPINCVDFDQAAAFCSAADKRLPTEAEWEYAASGGDDRLYSWGSQSPDDRACWKTNRACKVGSFPQGAFGLVDMTGNLWEWTGDRYGDYPWPAMDGPNRVYRGGSWSRRFDKWMRLRLRNRGPGDFSGSHLGFRCARAVPGEPCPFGADPKRGGQCLHGVLDVECKSERRWNGIRCAPPGESGCAEGRREVPGFGCVRDPVEGETEHAELDLASVSRTRSPDFDGDCQKFQSPRPHAYRFTGSTHDARNAVVKQGACKNRDVGNGWNSACCP